MKRAHNEKDEEKKDDRPTKKKPDKTNRLVPRTMEKKEKQEGESESLRQTYNREPDPQGDSDTK